METNGGDDTVINTHVEVECGNAQSVNPFMHDIGGLAKPPAWR